MKVTDLGMKPRPLSSETLSSGSWETPRCSQVREGNLSSEPGSAPGSLLSAWKTSKIKCSGGILIKCLKHLNTPFDAEEQQFYSNLPPDDWAPYPTSKAEPRARPPCKEAHFNCLDPESWSFVRDPDLMTIGESWNMQLKPEVYIHF